MACSIRTLSADGHQAYASYETETAGLNALNLLLTADRLTGHTVSQEGHSYIVTDKQGAAVLRYEFSTVP